MPVILRTDVRSPWAVLYGRVVVNRSEQAARATFARLYPLTVWTWERCHCAPATREMWARHLGRRLALRAWLRRNRHGSPNTRADLS